MWYTYQVEAIQTYSKALLKGHNYIFQSLPRLLTLWFDFASWLADQPKLSKALLAEQKKVGVHPWGRYRGFVSILITECVGEVAGG